MEEITCGEYVVKTKPLTAKQMFDKMTDEKKKYMFRNVNEEVMNRFLDILNENGGRKKYTFFIVDKMYRTRTYAEYNFTVEFKDSVIYTI